MRDGIAVRAGANEAVNRVTLARSRREQDAIAAAIAGTAVGESRPWSVDQRLVGDAHGEVRVIRVIESALTRCKEALFSVLEGDAPPAWFATTACEEGGRWWWAAAEPAVERWGTLQ